MKTLKNPVVHIANRASAQVDKPLCSAGIFIMQNQEEIWLPVLGYEGYYEVSNFGRIKSLQRERTVNKNGGKQLLKEKIIKPDVCCGYERVQLFKNSKKERELVHRIVAKAFIKNPDNKPCVNHIDENRSNNNVINLEWVTHKENINSGTVRDRISVGNSKPVVMKSKDGRVVSIFSSAVQAEKYGYNRLLICLCCNGKNKTHKKHIWEFYEP